MIQLNLVMHSICTRYYCTENKPPVQAGTSRLPPQHKKICSQLAESDILSAGTVKAHNDDLRQKKEKKKHSRAHECGEKTH